MSAAASPVRRSETATDEMMIRWPASRGVPAIPEASWAMCSSVHRESSSWGGAFSARAASRRSPSTTSTSSLNSWAARENPPAHCGLGAVPESLIRATAHSAVESVAESTISTPRSSSMTAAQALTPARRSS